MLSRIRVPLALLLGAAVGAGVTLTQGVLAEKQKATETLPLKDLQAFVEILNRVKTDYVEEVTDEALLENAVRGMLAGLDPHSAFLDKDEFKDINVSTSGKFGGLGIEVQLDPNGFVRVVAPIDETPAAKAGIQPGDLIIKIDEVPVKGMSLTEAVQKMRGEPGTTIVLSILRESANQPPFPVAMKRDVISVSSVRSRMLEPGIAYLRVTTFTSSTGRTLNEELSKLRKQAGGEIKGLILDLRNNPGGVLNASVEVADAFLDKGVIVSIKGREKDTNRDFNATPGDALSGSPMVVLVNAGSASASEIVAGALQDHKRAVLVGAKTFGKGSVQTILPLQNESAIKLTTARYYTPSGRSIQAHGIEPDIAIRPVKVSRDEQAAASGEPISEAALRGRLDNETAEPAATPDTQAEQKKQAEAQQQLVENDYALYESLNLLKGMVILQKK